MFAQTSVHFDDCRVDVLRSGDQAKVTAVCESAEPSTAVPRSPSTDQSPRTKPRVFSAAPAGGRYSLADCNAMLQPGDTCTLAPGDYPSAIRPARSGTPDQWITYRAAGPLTLRVEGHDLSAESGAVALTDRAFVAIDGTTKRWIRATPSGAAERRLRAGVVVNLYGGHDLSIRGVVARCPSIRKACSWVANLGIPDQVLSENPKATYNVRLSDCELTGSARSTEHPSDYTEDTLAAAGVERVLIERCQIKHANHVALAIGIRSQRVVVRDSVIRNRYHTAISAWGAGSGLWVDGNRVSAAPTGNCLQLGAPDALVTFNRLSRCGSEAAPNSSVGGVICASGQLHNGDPHVCQRTVIAGNVIQSYGPTIGVLDFASPAGSVPLGGNSITGNLLIGSADYGGVVYWDRVRPTGDQWTNNVFAGPGYRWPDSVIAEHIPESTGAVDTPAPMPAGRFIRRARREHAPEYRYREGWPEWMSL